MGRPSRRRSGDAYGLSPRPGVGVALFSCPPQGLSRTVQPNAGHYALVELEQRLGEGRFTLITQNVDGLHRAAGSNRLLELHGNLARVRCTGCKIVENRGQEELPPLPRCNGCGELLRPDIVWFNEPLPEDVWAEADDAARRCDCFLVVGTSGVVYPAAGLVQLARGCGACVIEINLDADTGQRGGCHYPVGSGWPSVTGADETDGVTCCPAMQDAPAF